MLTLQEALKERHSVRSYYPDPLKPEVVRKIEARIEKLNRESGLSMQLILNEPNGFSGMLAKYGYFQNVHNYIAIVGPDEKDLDEKAGFYGEDIVLYAQQQGLNTCWVALTFKKGAVKNAVQKLPGHRLSVVIAIGYGKSQGTAHKSKTIDAVCNPEGKPDWFLKGVQAALLAPTAVNRQNFYISLVRDNIVQVEYRNGFYSGIDLGIIKYSFLVGAWPQSVLFLG